MKYIHYANNADHYIRMIALAMRSQQNCIYGCVKRISNAEQFVIIIVCTCTHERSTNIHVLYMVFACFVCIVCNTQRILLNLDAIRYVNHSQL